MSYKISLNIIENRLIAHAKSFASVAHAFVFFNISSCLATLYILSMDERVLTAFPSLDLLCDSIIYLKFVSVLLSSALLFFEYWSQYKRVGYNILYSYVACLFCSPVIAGYTLSVSHDIFWVLSSLATFWVFVALLDWLSSVVLVAVSFVLGHLLYLAARYCDGLYLGKMMLDASCFTVSFYEVILLCCAHCFIGLIAFFLFVGERNIRGLGEERVNLFGGAVAHEINTPVTAMEMISETFSALTAEFAPLSEKIMTEEGEVECLLRLPQREYEMIFQVLPNNLASVAIETRKVIEMMFSMLENGRDVVNETRSVRQVVEETVRDFIEHNPKLKNRVMILSGGDVGFKIHKQSLKQVLLNLLINFERYAGEQASATIWIQNGALYFKDNGVGIHPAQLKNLFQAFKVSSTKGHGIGLAFCYLLIKNMGGDVKCRSEINRYTEFIITLPKIYV